MSNSTRTVAMRIAAIFSATVMALAGAEVANASAAPLAAVKGPVKVTITAPERVAKNGTATITVTTVKAHTGTATLRMRSIESHQWIQPKKIAIKNGKGTIKVKLTMSRAFKVEADVGGTSKVFGISMDDASKRGVSAAFTRDTFVASELAFIRGTAFQKGKPWKNTTVTIQRAKKGSSTWTKVGTVKTASNGVYRFRVNPSTAYVYRAMVASSAKSALTDIASTSGKRTLEARAAALTTAVTGAPSGSIKKIAKSKLPSGVSAARYRHYARATLVEVTKGSTVRTWLVYDRIKNKYASLKRWDGKLGLPMRDMKCGLLEGGCVQRFTGGALYQNTSSMSKGVYVAYGKVQEVEILAAAISQAGYVEKSWRKNKYNTWVKGSSAWCSVFVSWAAAASGNSGAVPKRKTFDGYLTDLKKSGVLKKSGKPPVGASVIFDWGSGTPSHAGLVRGHSGSSLLTVEGNTSNGKGSSARGVYLRTRPASDVWAWYWPHEYKG